MAYKTEKTYLFWIKRFIRFHGLQHPEAMGSGEVESFRDEALNSPSYWLEFA
ncbi:phage integrase N-terminal SAM-like domain-containing protein [uncultured Marinobacter sp.]|uniref:phage integrase N-terminal SAM-like domain-containing protein n=1 Tax=uncultured Marinobacter sp. TaxID=187379 RepID=UPI0025DB84C6|nr:phage integrase N-terminal SAM-like domain-containing protein [uncultured Marinobacter sp.]